MRRRNPWLVLGLMLVLSETVVAEQKVEIQSLLSAKLPVMLQFGKSWCPRCKSTKPILDAAARAFAGKAMIVPVDVETNRELVGRFNVRLIPTQVFLLPDGREFFRHEGILQEQHIGDIFARIGLQRAEIR